MYLADVSVGVISFSSCYKLAERKSPRMDGINAVFTFIYLKTGPFTIWEESEF
jgi:hypothetical protein